MIINKVIKKSNTKVANLRLKVKISTIVNQTLHNKIKLFASCNNLTVSALLTEAAKKYTSKS